MISYQDIQDVHLEISTLCNAACPLCPRNFRGYSYNDGYPELNFSLANARKIFTPDFLHQLTSIRINGNYGDAVMNPETVDIVDYFVHHNKNLAVSISTNGSARKSEFWQQLAHLGVNVIFCLDGLEDTHHLYRQNTVWSTVIKNAKTFIAAGGRATWKMIRFDHNVHQITRCRQLAAEMKFVEFQLVDHGRNIGPVFDNHGKLTHVIGQYSGPTEFALLFHKKQTDEVLLEDIAITRTPKQNVKCATVHRRSIYISATGDVSPCCWTGFYPATYGAGEYHQAINSQLQPLITKNNALQYPLIECVEWFKHIETSWNKHSYQNGRLVVCDDYCGH